MSNFNGSGTNLRENSLFHYQKKDDLAISIKALGAEHPNVAVSYNNIGDAFALKGDRIKAMTYFLKAKAIFLNKLGAEHPNTKAVQSSIDALR